MHVKVLVLGAGGREHALAWRLNRDSDVREVLSAPGNPGMAEIGPCLPVDLENPSEILALAARERVDLTVVGPEAVLDRGVADAFRDAGRPIVGPTRRGAALECSKAFSKAFMARQRIPTARFGVAEQLDEALSLISDGRFAFPVVVKADGLAAGKGVVIASDKAEAEAAVRAAMLERRFGSAGARLVIEECLAGPEVSCFVLTDGERLVWLGAAHDHKRIWDDDRGPNTGGMGAFTPSPIVGDDLQHLVTDRIVRPVLEGMRADGETYRGFLYVSLMLTADGPKVIEFNVRLGDPEAQVILPLLEGRFAQALLAAAHGSLRQSDLRPGADCYVGVVMATAGYPGASESGQPVSGLPAAADLADTWVFHSGTRMQDGLVVTTGGRTLTVVGRGSSYRAAMDRAYAGVRLIRFEGQQYRTDIGRRADQMQVAGQT